MNAARHSGVDKASADPAVREALCLGSYTNLQRTKHFVDSFGLDFIHLTECIILDPYYEILYYAHNL